MPVFMLKDIHHKSEIKAVLDQQLVNLRTYNIDPRALSHDKAGLRSTYSFEKAGNNRRSDEMLKTGKVPMDVHAMPGLVLEESDDEEKEIWAGVNIIPFSIPFGIDKFERNGGKFFNWGQIFFI